MKFMLNEGVKRMSSYCKAYSLAKLRQYPNWLEKSENARKENKGENGKPAEVPRELTDKDYLYLHESLVVTDGIFEDQNIIFADVTPEWEQFCKEVLKFEVPVVESNIKQKK
jgi:hypothetical protein